MTLSPQVLEWWIDEHAECLSAKNEQRALYLARLMVWVMRGVRLR